MSPPLSIGYAYNKAERNVISSITADQKRPDETVFANLDFLVFKAEHKDAGPKLGKVRKELKKKLIPYNSSPESVEGYRQFIAFRDTRSKYLFCYPVKTCNEDTFLYYLRCVLRFCTTRDFKSRVLRSDYYTTFRSTKANQFYEDNQCRHESSAPYQQWQNAVERDIQTILSNVSATIRGQDFLHADIWAHAVQSY